MLCVHQTSSLPSLDRHARPCFPDSLEVTWGQAMEFWPWNVEESDACCFQNSLLTKVPCNSPHPLSFFSHLLSGCLHPRLLCLSQVQEEGPTVCLGSLAMAHQSPLSHQSTLNCDVSEK